MCVFGAAELSFTFTVTAPTFRHQKRAAALAGIFPLVQYCRSRQMSTKRAFPCHYQNLAQCHGLRGWNGSWIPIYNLSGSHSSPTISWGNGSSTASYSHASRQHLCRRILQQRSKSIDMQFYWIQDQSKQGQFIIYCRPGTQNLGDYHTNHNSPYHNRQMRPTYLHETENLANNLISNILRGCVNLVSYWRACARWQPQNNLRHNTGIQT